VVHKIGANERKKKEFGRDLLEKKREGTKAQARRVTICAREGERLVEAQR